MNASTDLQVPHSTQTTDLILDFDALEKIERFAAKMAKARGTVPAHIAGNEGDCMAIVMQSMQWGQRPNKSLCAASCHQPAENLSIPRPKTKQPQQ